MYTLDVGKQNIFTTLQDARGGLDNISCLFFFFLIYLFMSALSLRCCVRASHCGGFSCCGAWALGARALVTVARRP